MKRYIPSIILSLCLLLGSCDIQRLPYDSLDSESIRKDPESSVDNLLNGAYAQLKPWSDVMHRCGEYAGDNIMIRGSSTDAFYEFISFSRTPNNYRLQSFWDSSYKIIAQTSNVIGMIDEGKSEILDKKLGECFLLRGMAYFYLVRAYGRPFFQDPDKNLGVPIINGTQDDVLGHHPDRSTVLETYKQAIGDLTKAESLLPNEKSRVSPAYGSREAAQALLSRIYLFMSGTYDAPNKEYAELAVKYADAVIASGKYQLLPREQFMRYNQMIPENNQESILVVKRLASEFSGYDHYYGVGGMYSVIGGMGWGEMYASAKYLELLDETGRNDWAADKLVDARAAFISPQYVSKEETDKVLRVVTALYDKDGNQTGYQYLQLALDPAVSGIYPSAKEMIKGKDGAADEVKATYKLTPVDAESGIYSMEYKGKTYEGVIDYKMKLNRAYPMFYITKCSLEGEESHLHSPVIIRLGEVYLNRAEALAKLGRYEEARTALNTIRERSLPGEGYAGLDESNAEMRIDKERQLELAFQAERSYDVFRNGRALQRHYPGPHDAMEDIPATDYRVVYFIPQDAINSFNATGSTLTQNPTSN